MAQVTPSRPSPSRDGRPTPDDLDSLITKVWKTPGFADPPAGSGRGREAIRRGVPPVVVSLFGAQFPTWRGIPIIPSDKVPGGEGQDRSSWCTGEESQGVVGLFQPGLVGEGPGSVGQVHGINRSAPPPTW